MNRTSQVVMVIVIIVLAARLFEVETNYGLAINQLTECNMREAGLWRVEGRNI